MSTDMQRAAYIIIGLLDGVVDSIVREHEELRATSPLTTKDLLDNETVVLTEEEAARVSYILRPTVDSIRQRHTSMVNENISSINKGGNRFKEACQKVDLTIEDLEAAVIDFKGVLVRVTQDIHKFSNDNAKTKEYVKFAYKDMLLPEYSSFPDSEWETDPDYISDPEIDPEYID
jgi:hypothetical protein